MKKNIQISALVLAAGLNFTAMIFAPIEESGMREPNHESSESSQGLEKQQEELKQKQEALKELLKSDLYKNAAKKTGTKELNKIKEQLKAIDPEINLDGLDIKAIKQKATELKDSLTSEQKKLSDQIQAAQKATDALSQSGSSEFDEFNNTTNSSSSPQNPTMKVKENFEKTFDQTKKSLEDIFNNPHKNTDLKEVLVQHIKELLRPLSTNREYQKALNSLDYGTNLANNIDMEVFDNLRKNVQGLSTRKQLRSQIDEAQNLFDQYAFKISKEDAQQAIQTQAQMIKPDSSKKDIEMTQQAVENSIPKQFLNSPEIQKINQEYNENIKNGTTYERFMQWIKSLLQALKDLKYTINQGIAKDLLNSIKPKFRRKPTRQE